MTRPILLVLLAFSCALAACDGDGGAAAPDTPAGGADTASGGDSFETCIPPRTPDFFVQTIELESADRATRVRLQVEPGEGNAVGETFAFHLHGFALEHDGVTTCVTEQTALTYVWGHHNWNETATAIDGATTYIVRMTFDWTLDGTPVWDDRISARDAGGAELWKADLPFSRCDAEGEGALNGCFQRERVDL